MGYNEMAPFKNLFNDFYARDISKKIRSTMTTKARVGIYHSTVPPFGYRKSPEDSHKLIPDAETAPIVDLKLWERVQEVNGKRRRMCKSTRKPGIFSGIAYCPDCGRRISFSLKRQVRTAIKRPISVHALGTRQTDQTDARRTASRNRTCAILF